MTGLLLTVRGDSCGDLADGFEINACYIPLTDNLRKRVRRNREIFLNAQASFQNIQRDGFGINDIYFWDGDPLYFFDVYDDSIEFDDAFIWLQETIQEDRVLLKKEFTVPEHALRRVECTQMCIREHGVEWITIPKHGDVYVRTELVPYDWILE